MSSNLFVAPTGASTPTPSSSSGHAPYHLTFVNIFACFLIGLSSMVSLFIFNLLIHRRNPFTATAKVAESSNGHANGVSNVAKSIIADPSKSEILKSVLSFAVGGLLGDVFLHLLPEASVQLARLGYSTMEAQQYLGVWILSGLILFVVFESIFVQLHSSNGAKEVEEEEEVEVVEVNGNVSNGGVANGSNLRHRKNGVPNGSNGSMKSASSPASPAPVNVTGYLNLLANGFDNFTHGMSVGASFLVSFKVGCLTTLAIAIHEIPHEIVDYVILLRSGFSCWNAFRAQLSISLVTILGSLTVLYFDSSNDTLSYTLWILPFTAGGFIYIALTSLLPELLHFEDSSATKVATKSSGLHNALLLLQRILFVLAGIATMGAVNVIDIF